MKNTVNRSDVLGFVIKTPGCTSFDLAAHFGIAENRAAGALSNVYCIGLVRREKMQIDGHVRKIFAYWINETPAVPKVVLKPAASTGKTEMPAVIAPKLPAIAGLDAMLDGIAHSFVDVLATKIKAGLTGRLQTMLAAPQVAENDPAPETPAEPEQMELITEAPAGTHALRRIGIVGILPNNIPEIDAEFGNVFRISYWHQNGHSGWDRLKAIAEFCDLVFVVKRNVSHRTTVHLQSNNANTLLIDGGVTTLKIALLEYLQGKVAA